LRNLDARGPIASVMPGVGPGMKRMGVAVSPNGVRAMNLRSYDGNGKLIVGGFTTTSHPTAPITVAGRVVSKVVVSMAGKMHRTELHITVRDLGVMGAVGGGARGGAN